MATSEADAKAARKRAKRLRQREARRRDTDAEEKNEPQVDAEPEPAVPQWATCVVCRYVMHEPRQFHCGHTVCLKCQLQVDSTCPTCRRHSRTAIPNLGLRDAIENVVAKKHLDEAARLFEEWQVDNLSKQLLESDHSLVFTKYNIPECEVDKKIDLCSVFRYTYWVERKKNAHRMVKMCKPYGTRVVKMNCIVLDGAGNVTDASILSQASSLLPPGYTTIVRKKRDFTYYVVYKVME